ASLPGKGAGRLWRTWPPEVRLPPLLRDRQRLGARVVDSRPGPGLCGGTLSKGASTMAVKIAINGFGRIGRCVLRAALSRKEDIEIVAINDLDKPSALAHLFKYDSVHRLFLSGVEATEKGLSIDGKEISLTAEK